MLRVFFSPMRNASARGRLIKATFNNTLPTQTGDVIVNPRNPVNPDSNNWLLRTQSLTIASTWSHTPHQKGVSLQNEKILQHHGLV